MGPQWHGRFIDIPAVVPFITLECTYMMHQSSIIRLAELSKTQVRNTYGSIHFFLQRR